MLLICLIFERIIPICFANNICERGVNSFMNNNNNNGKNKQNNKPTDKKPVDKNNQPEADNNPTSRQ